MANIQERRNKEGKLISFSIRVHRGRGPDGKQLKPYTTTFEVQPTWKEETARKKAEAFASVFEKECREGIRADNRQRFDGYCDYVIKLKEQRGAKHSTIVRYRELAKRIYPHIGHIKLCDLRVDHLNELYTALATEGENKKTGGKLSAKTITEHHRLISTVLEQAFKERLIVFNVARQAVLPRIEKKEMNHFQPEQIEAIREVLENEPLKWKTLVDLLIMTGARRGEILGLKWESVDFEKNQIHICNNVLYSADRGIYEDTPKTEKSKRYITLPKAIMAELWEYRKEQRKEFLKAGIPDRADGFVFAQSTGEAMHPDSVTDYLKKLEKKYHLPHLNAHAFRHTMASLLYFNGVDSVSISNRLGHAQVSTTANIYAHVIEEAEQRSADILSDIFMKKA
ncbi:tyrosine-type recombinase/integrase [Harryflintia acetispora]|uniref:Site-specific recombinase XerD n=1 Tax=Harryflintia acetispora TaxID=1849041 RepID=A0A9X8Y8W9_9FIRM|nr:tyrosine-type recombinase/integrase [Harryflintia acetispora]TCL44456.1 site-specific recombinase XerD [Harryflintia acetispora]